MDNKVQKYISNFVESQFPQFYDEEGSDLPLFMKAYYEWMESSGQPIYHSRRLYEYGDVDDTLSDFLVHFTQKYLHGIPFETISNKRFLLKHILDIYRSKGSTQSFRLLFKMLYDEDIEIYLPSNDMLRVSDGKWVSQKYLEITNSDQLNEMQGKTIIGLSSGSTAVVESLIREYYNKNLIQTIYLSNIVLSDNGFIIGEKVIDKSQQANAVAVSAAPVIKGSLSSLNITSSAPEFEIGDVLKVTHRDPANNDVVSFGKNALLRISGVEAKSGQVNFSIVDGGVGFSTNAEIFINNINSANGTGASIGGVSLSSIAPLTYNTDLICDYSNVVINATSYGMPAAVSANQTSTLGTAFTYNTENFGSIYELTDTVAGSGYDQALQVVVRNVILGEDPLTGTLVYTTSSNTITGTSTIFDDIYANGDVIYIQADSGVSTTGEYALIREVVSSSEITLYAPPLNNSTGSAIYKAAPTTLPSQFASYEAPMYNVSGDIHGENEEISGVPSVGEDTASVAVAVDSGKGYIEGEIVQAYRYNIVSSDIVIDNGGLGYSNTDSVFFSGGSPGTIASGTPTTDSNGTITAVTLTNTGSGYESTPVVRVKTTTGAGALISCSLQEFDTTSTGISGTSTKQALGVARGYWGSTDSFLNSDKYIQDSHYYQDYSYEIQVAKTLKDYKDIILNSFHVSGSELFGKYLDHLQESKINTINNEYFFTGNNTVYTLVSETAFTSDSNTLTVDKLYI